jgi:hypothetical protein
VSVFFDGATAGVAGRVQVKFHNRPLYEVVAYELANL